MTGSGSHSGSGVGDAIRKGVGLVHGTGEAIRGNFNAAVDSATGDREAAARNQNIATRGIDEMEHGHYHGTGAGVTPADTDRERVNRAAQGESGTIGSTKYGPHGTNVGNKLDPRYDSDVDHRGTVAGSTNYGPHATNVGNKVDPRYDSDLDHRGTTTGSTNYGPHGTNTANKLDPRIDSDRDHRAAQETDEAGFHPASLTVGPHQSNTANILDPRVRPDPSLQNHRGAMPSAGESSPQQPSHTHRNSVLHTLDPRRLSSGHARRASHDKPIPRTDTFNAPQRSDTAPHLQRHPSEELEKYERRPSKAQHAPHSSHNMNVLDPRVGAAAPRADPHSTSNPHESGFLNLLDPRVDRNTVKKRGSRDDGAYGPV